MSLLVKSEHNWEAALFLESHKKLSPAVHCCYYSCYQKIIYVLKEYFTEEYERIEEDKGSHRRTISTFLRCLREKDVTTKEGNTDFKRSMNALKAFRMASDYEDSLIDQREFDEVKKNWELFHTTFEKEISQ